MSSHICITLKAGVASLVIGAATVTVMPAPSLAFHIGGFGGFGGFHHSSGLDHAGSLSRSGEFGRIGHLGNNTHFGAVHGLGHAGHSINGKRTSTLHTKQDVRSTKADRTNSSSVPKRVVSNSGASEGTGNGRGEGVANHPDKVSRVDGGNGGPAAQTDGKKATVTDFNPSEGLQRERRRYDGTILWPPVPAAPVPVTNDVPDQHNNHDNNPIPPVRPRHNASTTDGAGAPPDGKGPPSPDQRPANACPDLAVAENSSSLRTQEKPGTGNPNAVPGTADARNVTRTTQTDADRLQLQLERAAWVRRVNIAREERDHKGDEEFILPFPVSVFDAPPDLPPLDTSAPVAQGTHMRIVQGFYEDRDAAAKALKDPSTSTFEKHIWQTVYDEAVKYIDIYEKARPQGVDVVEKVINEELRKESVDEMIRGAKELMWWGLPIRAGEAVGIAIKLLPNSVTAYFANKLGLLADRIGTAGMGYSTANLDRVALAALREASREAGVFYLPSGQLSRQALLPCGEAGQEMLEGIGEGLPGRPQHGVYAGSINNYAQAMIDGKFDWPIQGDIIRIRNGVIVSGHHRLIAARLAAQATGRPLFAGPNAIIPKGAIAFESGGNLDGVGKAWGRIGVDPGTKPSTSIGYGNDPEHQALKEMMGSDD